MKTDLLVVRQPARRLPAAGERRRLVVITGARQTGKTTLAREVRAALRYLNLDAIESRAMMRDLRTSRWGEEVGAAVLDTLLGDLGAARRALAGLPTIFPDSNDEAGRSAIDQLASSQ